MKETGAHRDLIDYQKYTPVWDVALEYALGHDSPLSYYHHGNPSDRLKER